VSGSAVIRAARADLVAGVALAGLLLPEAVAYAGIAGLPPAAGLVGAIAGLGCYALLGTSRHGIVAATSSSAVVLAGAVQAGGAQAAGFAGVLVALTGLLFLGCAVLRLGLLAQFIARPVVRGLALGLAITITLRQLPSLLGLHAATRSSAQLLAELLQRHREWQLAPFLAGAVAFVLLWLLRHRERAPAALIVIGLGALVQPWLAAAGVPLPAVGAVDFAALRPAWPHLQSSDWLRALELAVALLLILFAESYGAVRACALRHGEVVDANRELLALGAANLLSGALQGTPVGAGYSATTANEGLGARSRRAGVFALAAVAVVALFLRGGLARIPQPVLAALVVWAMRHAFSLAPLRPYLRWRRDRTVLAVAVGAVLWLGVLDGLLAAVALSLALLIRQLARPRIVALGRVGEGHDFAPLERHEGARPVPGLLVLRPEEPLFFANAEAVLDSALARLAAEPAARAMVLSLEESPDLDGTAIEALGQFAAIVARQGTVLRLARLKDRVRDVLGRAALPGIPDAALTTGSVDAVVTALQRDFALG
jgi:MFS superfamily sulfate permease-like transporter